MKVRRIIKHEIEVEGLGDRIKQARIIKNKPITKLADEVGVSRNYWYQLEAEATLSGLSEETLRKIEEVLETNLGVNF